MSEDLKLYLLEEIAGHIQSLAGAALDEMPDVDKIEYHREKAENALGRLKAAAGA